MTAQAHGSPYVAGKTPTNTPHGLRAGIYRIHLLQSRCLCRNPMLAVHSAPQGHQVAFHTKHGQRNFQMLSAPEVCPASPATSRTSKSQTQQQGEGRWAREDLGLLVWAEGGRRALQTPSAGVSHPTAPCPCWGAEPGAEHSSSSTDLPTRTACCPKHPMWITGPSFGILAAISCSAAPSDQQRNLP